MIQVTRIDELLVSNMVIEFPLLSLLLVPLQEKLEIRDNQIAGPRLQDLLLLD